MLSPNKRKFVTRKLFNWLKIVLYHIKRRTDKNFEYLYWHLISISTRTKCKKIFKVFQTDWKATGLRSKALINCIRRIDNRNAIRQTHNGEKMCATFLTMRLTSVFEHQLSVLLCDVIYRELMYKVLHFLVYFCNSKGRNFELEAFGTTCVISICNKTSKR